MGDLGIYYTYCYIECMEVIITSLYLYGNVNRVYSYFLTFLTCKEIFIGNRHHTFVDVKLMIAFYFIAYSSSSIISQQSIRTEKD